MKKSNILILSILLLIIFTLIISNTGTEEIVNQEITIGYFPNITHAPGLIGIGEGIFEDKLEGITIKTQIFPNGSLFMDALSTGQIDLGYVGPGPALNRYLQGADVKALASASTGGTVLVTRADLEFNSPSDLDGKIVATPALGCTHDLILRKLLNEYGMATTRHGGTVDHRAQTPANMLALFATNQLDAAMVPEPWAARIEEEAGGKVVVEWNEIPWEGTHPESILVSTNEFIEDNPEILESFLKAHLQSIEFINQDLDRAALIMQKEIKELSRQELDIEVIKRSLTRTIINSELNEDILQEFANLSKELGFIRVDANLDGFVNTSLVEDIRNAYSK
ncbi:aliphatic sulfonate ABC transporter substrate-binding protein [Natronospora cellulosivora (SeqCode)]